MDGRRPIRRPLFSLVLALCWPGPVSAAPEVETLAKTVAASCREAAVVLLGERHGQPESHELFLGLVAALSGPDARTLVALEIPGDRDADLRAALAGLPTPEFPVVDGPSFRALLRSLGRAAEGLAVVGMDASGRDGGRDEAMALTLGRAVRSGRYDRVVALVGNVHALKSVPWSPELRAPPRKLAGRLADQGVAVSSVVQWFPEEACGGQVGRFHGAGVPGSGAVVRNLWSRLNTALRPGFVAEEAADGAVIWSCPPAGLPVETATGRP